MSDLISRESIKNAILEKASRLSIQKNPDTANGLMGAYQLVYEEPSADIMECARAIKEYCKDRTNKPIWCNDCPLYEPFCKINTPPNMWDLPEGEKK